MATIREIQASFVARANGMKSTIQGVKKEISNLAKDTKKMSDGMDKSFNKGTSNISRHLRDMSLSASKSFEDIGKSIQSVSTRLESWGKDIKTFGKTTSKVLSPLTAFYTTAAITGGRRMAANEQLDILMRNVFRTEEAYEAAWDAVNGLTKGTAFMNADVGQWLSQLVQSNVELERSEDVMKSILDFSVGSGQLGIEGEIHDIIMKAVRAGGWDQMTLDMLAQRGLNLAGHVANVLGITTESAQEMLKDGTISMTDSLDYFVDAVQVGSEGAGGYFAGMAGSAQAGGETFTGALVNMGAAVAQLGERMWKSGAWDTLKEAMNNIYDFLQELAPALDPVARIISSILATMVDWVQKLMTAFINLRPKTQALIAGLSVLGAVLGPAIFMFGAFVEAVGKALKPLGTLFTRLSRLFKLFGEKGLAGVLKAVAKRFAFLTNPITIVVGLFTLLYTASETFRKALHDVIKSVIDFGKRIYDMMKPAIDTVIDSFKILVKSFKGTGGGLDNLGAAFAPLLDIVGLLAKTILSGLAFALSLILPLLSGVARAIGPLVKALGNLISVVVNLGMAILSVFILDFSKAMDHFKTAFQSVIDVFKNLWDAFYGFFEGIITTLLVQLESLFGGWDKLESLADRVWNTLISLFHKVKDAFSSLTDSLSVDPIKGFFTDIGMWFRDGFASILESIKNTGVRIAEGLTEGISQGLESTSSKFNNVGNRISEAIDTSISNSLNYFSAIGERISESIAGGLISKAGDLVTDYIDSVKESFQSVGGIATMIGPSIIGIGSRMLGLTGPIGLIISIIVTLINTLMDLYQTNEGFRNFIQNTWEAIQSVFSDVLQALQPLFDEFNQAFSEIAKELGPEFAKTKEVISDSINELKPTFQELGVTFSELGTTLFDLFKEIGQVVGDLIREIVPIWIEFQLTIISTIGEIVKIVIPSLLDIFKTVIPMIIDIVKSFASIYIELFSAVIGVVLDIVKTVLPMLLSVVQSVFPVILDVISTVTPIIVEAFSAVIDVVLELVKTILPMILSVVQAVLPMVLKIIKSVLPMVISIFTSLIDVVLELVRAVLPMILSIVQSVFPMILKIIKTVLPIVINLITSVVNIILELAKQVIPLILQVVQMAFPIIQKIIETAMKIVTTVLEALVAVIQNVVVPAIEFILKVVQTIFPVITKVIEGALNIVIGILEFFISLFTGNWSGMWEAVKRILKGALDIVWSVIKGVFDLIALFIKTTFTAISNFFSSIWSTITKLFKSVLSTIYNYVKDRFTAVKNTTTDIFNAVWTFIKDVWDKIKKYLFDTVSNIFTRVRDTWNDLKTRTTEIFTGIYDSVKEKFDDIVDAAKKLPKRIGDGIGEMASKVTNGVKKVTNKLAETLGKGINGVIGGINWVLEKIGVGEGDFISKWPVPEYAKGTKGHPGGLAIVGDGGEHELIQTPDGELSLSPDKDTLVDLPRGTSVLSGKKTKEFLSNIPMYASGIGNIWEGAKDLGGKIKDGVVSGVKKVGEWAGNVWDYVKEPGKLLDIALKTLGVEIPKGGSFIGNTAKAGFKMVKDKAVDFVKEKLNLFTSSAPGAGSGVQRWAGVATNALRMTGQYTKANLDRLLYQMQTESGGNPRAINLWDINAKRGTPSKGLMQVIDPTFRAYRMPGFNNIWNPLDNILASIRYAVSRYGSLARAYRGVGYADGGIVNTKQLAWIAEGGWAESIISHDPSKRVRQQRIWQETGDRLGFTSDKSNKEILAELRRIAKAVENGKDMIIVMDEEEVGRAVEPYVTERQDRGGYVKGKYGGW